MSLRRWFALVALVSLGVQASAMDNSKCPDQGTEWVMPMVQEATGAQGEPVGKTCLSLHVSILGLPPLSFTGEWCPSYIFLIPAHHECGVAGAAEGLRCVPNQDLAVLRQDCDCVTLGWGMLSLPTPFCACETANMDAGKVKDYSAEPCD